MRILMLNRADTQDVPGGDTVQMLETKACLERLGVDVTVGLPGDAAGGAAAVSRFDLVHVFNVSQLAPILAAHPALGRGHPPVVVSTIFWFHTGHWFEQAASAKAVWKLVGRLMTPDRATQAYEKWQEAKFRFKREGRTLREALGVPARLLPNSRTEIAHLESLLGLAGSLEPRSTIVPNGVSRKLYDKLPSGEALRKKYELPHGFVLQVARIQSEKNQRGLIQALFDLPIPIVFVGQASPYQPEYFAQCHELARKRGNVYFLGKLSGEEVAGLYPMASVHVLPSWRETPGLASLEAAAAGCRLVSTAVGSAREYFGDLAWYCEPGNLGSIRQSVLQALDAPPSDQLRHVVLERYTWEAAARATLQAYHLSLNNPAPRRSQPLLEREIAK